jgi:hypothetical protein
MALLVSAEAKIDPETKAKGAQDCRENQSDALNSHIPLTQIRTLLAKELTDSSQWFFRHKKRAQPKGPLFLIRKDSKGS